MHKGKRQYNLAEVPNINLMQNGYYHATPVAGDIHIAGSEGELVIDFAADGPSGDTTDTWLRVVGHNYIPGDRVVITDPANYNTPVDGGGNPTAGVVITEVKENFIAIADGYVAEDFGVKATATFTVADYPTIENLINENPGSLSVTDMLGNIVTIKHSGEVSFSANEGKYIGAVGDNLSAALIKLVFEGFTDLFNFSNSSNVVTVEQKVAGVKGNTSASSDQKYVTAADFTGGKDSEARVSMFQDPLFEYPNDKYFLGVGCLPTVDNDQTATNAPLLTVDVTPYDTKMMDQSKADTPGDPITIKLQAGQFFYGAFKRVKVNALKNCTMILHKE